MKNRRSSAKNLIDEVLSEKRRMKQKRYRTGHKCPRSGLYRSICEHKELIPLSRGERFPPCSEGDHAVRWRLVTPADLE